MKKTLLLTLLAAGITATAQVKVGNNPTTLATNANFQVEGTTTANQFVVLKNGNVGIGTNAPTNKLHINVTEEWGGIQVDNTSTTTSGAAQLVLKGSRSWALQSNGSTNGNGAGALQLVDNDASNAVRMTFDSSGKVGFRTPFPQTSFHVDGAGDNLTAGVPAPSQIANDMVVTSTGNVGIGTISPNSSSLLDIDSTTKGFLPPRMTTTQQAVIASPAKGLVLYNTTLDCLQVNIGTPASPSWECIGASAASTLIVDCIASRFGLLSPAQDPTCQLISGISGYQVKFVIKNNSFVAINNLDLSTAVSLTGVGAAGLTVTAGQNSNVSINSAATVTLTYNLAGSPTTAGSINATFTKLGLTCTVTNTVIGTTGNGNNGSSASLANFSCLAIINSFPNSADGVYWIDLDGTCSPNNNAMQAYCDMTTDGGGWTLVGQYNHSGVKNILLRSNFPNLGSNTPGNESSSTGIFGTWGLLNPTIIAQIPKTQYRVEAFAINSNTGFHVKVVNNNAFVNGTGQNVYGANLTDLAKPSYWPASVNKINFAGLQAIGHDLTSANSHTFFHSNGGCNGTFAIARTNNVSGPPYFNNAGCNTTTSTHDNGIRRLYIK